MDILLDTFKTCFNDLVMVVKELIKEIKKDFIFITDLFFICKVAQQIFKAVKIEPISIRFPAWEVITLVHTKTGHKKKKTRLYFNCHFHPREKGLHIGFGLPFLLTESYWNTIFENVNYEFKTKRDKLFFIVAHEIGHYIQWKKYNKWYKRESFHYALWADSTSGKVYRAIPIEHKADRLAIGIYKRLKGLK